MEFSFTCKGHRNVLSAHGTTLEFTKDKELTLKGDCILGVEADFSYAKLKEFILSHKEKKIIMDLSILGKSCQIQFATNPDFSDAHEIVIRKGGFLSSRTLGLFSTLAARDIPREIVKLMQNPLNTMQVVLRA